VKKYKALSGDIETDASPFAPFQFDDDDAEIDGLKGKLRRAFLSAGSTHHSGTGLGSKARPGATASGASKSSNAMIGLDSMQKESGKMRSKDGLAPPQQSCVVTKRIAPLDISYLGELLVR